MTYRDSWEAACRSATTEAERRCIAAAADNATGSAVELFSDEWFRVALATYEFSTEQ